MTDWLQNVTDWLSKSAGPLALAMAGATVQCLRGPWRGWRNFLVSNATAAFGGVCVMLILPHYVDYDVAAGLAGIVGYSGGSLIDAMLDRAKREIESGNK